MVSRLAQEKQRLSIEMKWELMFIYFQIDAEYLEYFVTSAIFSLFFAKTAIKFQDRKSFQGFFRLNLNQYILMQLFTRWLRLKFRKNSNFLL